MKNLNTSLAILLIIFLPLMAGAQMADEAEIKEVKEKYDLGLKRQPSLPFFDLSRLNLSHSYSLTYFSGSGYSGTQGYYSGTLRYKLAQPLTLTLNVGILHDPSTLVGAKSFSDNSAFFPSGWLDWRPSDNFRMSIGFETMPLSSYKYRGYYPYSGRPWYWRYR
jgi:hypothetical protein